MRRVVITGMGIYSCLGQTLEDVCQSLYDGKSGIIVDETRRAFGFRSCLTGNVPLPNLKEVLNRHDRALMPEQAMYAYCATREAFMHAVIDSYFMIK